MRCCSAKHNSDYLGWHQQRNSIRLHAGNSCRRQAYRRRRELHAGKRDSIEASRTGNRNHHIGRFQHTASGTLRSRERCVPWPRHGIAPSSSHRQRGTVQDLQSPLAQAVLQVQAHRPRGLESAKNRIREILVSRRAGRHARRDLPALFNQFRRMSGPRHPRTAEATQCCDDQKRRHQVSLFEVYSVWEDRVS